MKSRLLLGVMLGLLICIGLTLSFSQYLPAAERHKTADQIVDWSLHNIDQVRVYKSARELHILEQDQVIKIYKMRLGFSPVGHKTTEGDGKTPEGKYILDWRNPNSEFYKSLHVSYPNEQDRAQATARGVSAGGLIMIHGSNQSREGHKGGLLYNYLPRDDWTFGCIAVSNQDMDELWDNIENGTPIEIFP